MTIRLKTAGVSDVAAIAGFNAAMAAETEDKALDAATVEAGVSALIDDPAKGRYWVAEVDGRVVGQIMITYEWSDWRNATIWWIQSVYVAPSHRRQGVFSALYRYVESQAREDAGVCGLRLYVEKDNLMAQKTYTALGMSRDTYQVMEAMFG